MKIIAPIFGHSHVWGIKNALSRNLTEFSDELTQFRVVLCGTKKFPGELLYRSLDGKETINPALLAALSDYPPQGTEGGEKVVLISSVQGNYYNSIGMLDEGIPFDFIVPGYDDIPYEERAANIPYNAIQDAIVSKANELAPFFAKLRGMGYANIVHLGAPPPHPDSDYIYRELTQTQRMSLNLSRVTPANVRRKLWLVQEHVLGELCKKSGVRYLSAPEDSMDEQGFLKLQYCKDPAHGTWEYSRLVLNDVKACLVDDNFVSGL